jgi:hypothetical protein
MTLRVPHTRCKGQHTKALTLALEVRAANLQTRGYDELSC